MPTTNSLQTTNETSISLMKSFTDEVETHRVQVENQPISTIMNFTVGERKGTIIYTPEDGKMEVSVNGNVVGEITNDGLIIE